MTRKTPPKPKTYFGIERSIRYFPDGSFRYADVRPVLDNFDEPPEGQELHGIIEGKKCVTWFTSEKKRDAVLAKIKEAIFIDWVPMITFLERKFAK